MSESRPLGVQSPGGRRGLKHRARAETALCLHQQVSCFLPSGLQLEMEEVPASGWEDGGCASFLARWLGSCFLVAVSLACLTSVSASAPQQLPWLFDTPSSLLKPPVAGAVVHASSPMAPEAEAGGPQVPGQPAQLSNTRLKKKRAGCTLVVEPQVQSQHPSPV